MTVVPTSNQPSINKKTISQDYRSNNNTPVLALKELVANLRREQNKIQNLLSSLGFALRSFNNLNQFLELTPLMAARVTDAEGGALILYRNKNKVSLEQLYCQNSETGEDIRRTIEQAIHQINIAKGIKFRTADVSLNMENDCFSVLFEQKIQTELEGRISLFSTPILVKNVERGRLYVFSSDPEYLWTQTKRKLAQFVADQTAVAIAQHELTVVLRSKERQDRDLEIASEIQLRLLPRKCPKIQGVELAAKCKTANRVGGDYYDFIPANYDQLKKISEQNSNTCGEIWSIVIGEVMGKGVSAGLIMTMTRGMLRMLRAEVSKHHSPAKILEHLNRAMYADLENSNRFVTLFFSRIYPTL